MKLKIPLFVCIIFFTLSVKCQDVLGLDTFFTNNLSSVFQNPYQTKRVANYILENAITDSIKAQAHYLLSVSEDLEGNELQSLQDVFVAKKYLKKQSSSLVSTLVYSEISKRYAVAGMTSVNEKYTGIALECLDKINRKENKEIATTIIALNHPCANDDTDLLDEILQQLLSIESEFKSLSPIYLARVNNKIATIYSFKKDVVLAIKYFKRALRVLKVAGIDNATISSISYEGLGTAYFAQGDFETSKLYFLQALSNPLIEKRVRFTINNGLSGIYRNQDSTLLLQKYYNENILLHSELQKEERAIRSVLISYMDQEQEYVLNTDKREFYIWGAILLFFFILAFIIYFFYNKKLDAEYERFKGLIVQIEKDKNVKVSYKIEEVVAKPTKAIVISEETTKLILERLLEFENSTKFTDSKMTLTVLSKELKSNSKYISEIIHTYKEKNYNSYINELRINYIINLMKIDSSYLNYKVSYLAESCGFSSHSAFTVVFKNVTGFTPKQFITFLKKSKKENFQK